MKRFAFLASLYWEIHWFHRLIKETGWDVITSAQEIAEYCHENGFTVGSTDNQYDGIIVQYFHMSENAYIIPKYYDTGRAVVLIQHAWDPALHLSPKFWNFDMTKFTHMILGSKQDYDWLEPIYHEKVSLLGIPRLDDLYEVEHEDRDLEDIYTEAGARDFYLVSSPPGTFGDGFVRVYRERLPGDSPKKLVFKTHPNCSPEYTVVDLAGQKAILIPDDRKDHLKTYRMIKASSGVVCAESFMSIEASLMKKPVIFYGHDDISSHVWNMEENTNQRLRAPMEMASSLDRPSYTDKQSEVASWYLYDGKNTERVVKYLYTIREEYGNKN